MHHEDTVISSYASVEGNESSGTHSIVVISEQPGNADTLEVFTVPDLPSGVDPGEDPETDALVRAAAARVLLDASYELTSDWRAGDGCHLVGVAVPERVFKERDERLRAAAAAVEGLEPLDRTEAETLFETAEITPDGDLGTAYELDEWLKEEVNVAFYRTADGRLLARPVDRFERPSSKLFSGRYKSASLVSVFPNARPAQAVVVQAQGVSDEDESDDDFEDEDGRAPERAEGNGDKDAFPPPCANADVSWPPVQRLNSLRARQFLLATVDDRDPVELRWNDRLLVRGHALAFYAGAGPAPRELIVRHYGGPRPGILPGQPPQTLGEGDDAYRLVATYDGPALLGKDRRHAVSTMPLESYLTVCVSPVDGQETEYALCVRDGVLHRLKDEGRAQHAVTVPGTHEPGSDPLALALPVLPDLLTFPPTAAVDISTSAPHAVADAVRFTSSPGENTWEERCQVVVPADEVLVRPLVVVPVLSVQVGGSRFVADIVHALIGGLDETPDAGREGDLKNYQDVTVFADFEPDDEEGLTFLRVLGDRYGDASPVRKRIDAYLAEVAPPDTGRLRGRPGESRDPLTA
ncbi:hypothetical protein AB0M41_39330 [Streptomyces sp. NPDC051896]|uniref:hypothetical protein n=1 Tax=Streptomyces sp. NPDC051896 TaxID=3155416 RepID=UPI00342F56AC